MLMTLSDKQLLDAYQTAIQLKLEKEFIAMLERELQRRNLDLLLEPKWV